MGWKISETSQVEKAQETRQVIFHQDGLSQGQRNALQESAWYSCHTTVSSSPRSWRDRGGRGKCVSFRVFLSPLPPRPGFVAWSWMASFCPHHHSACSLFSSWAASSSQMLRRLWKVPPGQSVFRKVSQKGLNITMRFPLNTILRTGHPERF